MFFANLPGGAIATDLQGWKARALQPSRSFRGGMVIQDLGVPGLLVYLQAWKARALYNPKSPKAVLFWVLAESGTKKDHRRKNIAMPRFYGRGFIAMLLDSTAEGL